MKTIRVMVGIAVIGITAMAVQDWTTAQGAASDGLTAQDYADIQQLYWRYNQGADFRDGGLFVSAFADDAVMQIGTQKISGKDELTAWRMERDEGKTGDIWKW